MGVRGNINMSTLFKLKFKRKRSKHFFQFWQSNKIPVIFLAIFWARRLDSKRHTAPLIIIETLEENRPRLNLCGPKPLRLLSKV